MKTHAALLLSLALGFLAAAILLTPPIDQPTPAEEAATAAPQVPTPALAVLADPVAVPGGDAPGPHEAQEPRRPQPAPAPAPASTPAAGSKPGSASQGEGKAPPAAPAVLASAAAPASGASIPAPATLERARALQKLGNTDNLAEARRMYSDLLVRGVDPAQRQDIVAQLVALNDILFFSPEPCPGAHYYTVKPGDALSRIAAAEGQSLGVIMATNHISNPDRIRVGRRLKVIEGRVYLKVDKENLRMALMCDDAFIREWPIGIGSYGRTPTGTFVIETRAENPDWYTPNGGVIRFGEEGHAIGTRWLGFRPTRDFDGYGIHGTNEPHTVPGRESAGCIRMLNEHVEELYPLVAAGTEVVIG